MAPRQGIRAVLYRLGAGILLVLPILFACSDSSTDPNGDGETTGSILVSSTPAGAMISIDGAVVSGVLTNALLDAIGPGGHTVRVSRTGYVAAPESLVVSVTAGDTATAPFVLSPSGEVGAIFVGSDPSGAEIYLDGTATGSTTPDTLAGVAAGSHVVKVELAGYTADPESIVVNVSVEGVIPANFTLSPAAQGRIVLVEHFSNTSCDPCEEVELALDLAMDQFEDGRVVSFANHLNWPSSTDPFYLQNPTQLMERRAQFNVMLLPTVFVDGTIVQAPLDYDLFVEKIGDALQEEPYFEIDVSRTLQGDSIIVSGRVEMLQETAAGDEVLIVAVIETDIDYSAANGLEHFDDIVRRYLPGTNGVGLEMEVGEEHTFRFAEFVPEAWTMSNLEAVAFVESPSTRIVLQANDTR